MDSRQVRRAAAREIVKRRGQKGNKAAVKMEYQRITKEQRPKD